MLSVALPTRGWIAKISIWASTTFLKATCPWQLQTTEAMWAGSRTAAGDPPAAVRALQELVTESW